MEAEKEYPTEAKDGMAAVPVTETSAPANQGPVQTPAKNGRPEPTESINPRITEE